MARSDQKPTRSLLERRVKALEEYLGVVFKESDDYDDYVLDEYGTLASFKKDIKEINEKVFPKKEPKKYLWQ